MSKIDRRRNRRKSAFLFSATSILPVFPVRLRETGTLIGRVEATLTQDWAETAYLFAPRHWGQGYATEAMTAFQNELRRNEQVTEFWATTTPQNTRSIALLERLGYQQMSESWPPLLLLCRIRPARHGADSDDTGSARSP
jgi:GNAT superfamily N-acetyltransferase